MKPQSSLILVNIYFYLLFYVYAFRSLGLESLMLGLFNDKANKFGWMSDALLNHLFEQENKQGSDLASININRGNYFIFLKKKIMILFPSLNHQIGRDHGLPSYTHMRSFCNLSPVSSFEDLYGQMNSNSVEKLKSVYR